jgi:hypothetical protein
MSLLTVYLIKKFIVGMINIIIVVISVSESLSFPLNTLALWLWIVLEVSSPITFSVQKVGLFIRLAESCEPI